MELNLLNQNVKPEPEPGTNTGISSSGFESNDVRRVFIRKGISLNSNELKKTGFGDILSPAIHSFCHQKLFHPSSRVKKGSKLDKSIFYVGNHVEHNRWSHLYMSAG